MLKSETTSVDGIYSKASLSPTKKHKISFFKIDSFDGIQ